MNERSIYLGIDNGVSGALVALSSTPGAGIISTLPMPVVKTRRGNEVNVVAVSDWYHGLNINGRNTLVVIEEPGGSKSAKAATSMAGSFHALRALFELRHFPLYRVTPQKWQKKMLNCAAGETKPVALQLARSLWPRETWLDSPRCRTPNHNVVDAAVIAEYARQCRL